MIPENTDDPASLGFTGIVPKNGATASVPHIDIDGEFSIGSSFGGPQSRGDDTFDLSDTASWIRGDHSVQFGFGWSHFNQDAFFDFANSGLFVFAGIFGTPTVDFLAGTPLLYLQAGLPELHFRQNSFAWFVNDNWRVSDRLTVNLGLRYELFLPAYETQDQIGTVDFIGNKEVGDAQSQRFSDAPPGLLFPGDPGIPRSTTETDYSNFAPRIGLAYDLTGDSRMTLRAGYGIYYNLLNLEPQLNFLFGQPFGLQTTLGPAVGGGAFVGGPFGGFVGGPQHFGAPFSGQTNPFPPSGEFVPPAELSVLGPRVQTPYSHQFSLSYQWEVVPQYLLEIAYVGSTGVHLLLADRYNLIPYSRRPDNTIDILDSAPGNTNILQNQFLQDTAANSSYHSLQMSLNRRFSNGLGLLGSYTYGHSLDNSSGFRDANFQDPLRRDLERANSDFDLTHRFVLSYQWELPFGGNERWGSNAHGFLGWLIGGWQTGGIFSASGGFPLRFSVSGAATNGVGLPDRPSLAPGENPKKRGDITRRGVDEGTTYFNTDAFIRCDAPREEGGLGDFCFGDLGRRFLRGPGSITFDFLLMKRSYIPQINEVSNLEFRFEAFNLFNTPQFSDPGSLLPRIIPGSSFGRITSTKSPPRRLQFALKFNF